MSDHGRQARCKLAAPCLTCDTTEVHRLHTQNVAYFKIFCGVLHLYCQFIAKFLKNSVSDQEFSGKRRFVPCDALIRFAINRSRHVALVTWIGGCAVCDVASTVCAR